jgi:hypothetical protein
MTSWSTPVRERQRYVDKSANSADLKLEVAVVAIVIAGVI